MRAGQRRKAEGARRTPKRDPDAIGIVGLGLMGGSLARSLRRRFPRQTLIGIEIDARTRALARESGVFDAVLSRPSSDLSRCSVVVLCAPVPRILRLLRPVSRHMREGAVVTDVGGVKEPIVAAAAAVGAAGISFVGAHPMFGGEQGGFALSRADLWKTGTVAVCEDGADRDDVERVARLHRDLGARVILCAAADHDAAVAAVSHLPYVLASALSVTARQAGDLAGALAGKGLADATRLAAFDFGVQGEAARANSRLRQAARSFERNFQTLLAALLRGSSARRPFDRARAARKSLASTGSGG